MNILLLDDDLKFIESLKKEITLKLYNYNIRTNYICVHNQFDNIYRINYQLAFIDIELNIDNANGIDIAKTIKKKNPNCIIIFMSALLDLVYSSLLVQPYYFIRKSYLQKDLEQFFVLFSHITISNTLFLIQNNYLKKFVICKDIMYFESKNGITKAHLLDTFYIDSRGLKHIKKLIQIKSFVQIHKSIIINLEYVRSYKGSWVTLTNHHTLPIGRVYKDSFIANLKTYLLNT